MSERFRRSRSLIALLLLSATAVVALHGEHAHGVTSLDPCAVCLAAHQPAPAPDPAPSIGPLLPTTHTWELRVETRADMDLPGPISERGPPDLPPRL